MTVTSLDHPASQGIVGRWLGVSVNLDGLSPAIGAAVLADGVRKLRLAALWADGVGRRGALPVRTPLPRLGARRLPLWNGHLVSFCLAGSSRSWSWSWVGSCSRARL